MRRTLAPVIAILLGAGCGGGGTPPPQEPAPEPEPDPRTALQIRQDAACERVIPRLTQCAVDDARARLTPEEYAKNEIDQTAPIHTREKLRECKAHRLSSRQVRVYEVCDREETECAALVTCLEHLAPQPSE